MSSRKKLLSWFLVVSLCVCILPLINYTSPAQAAENWVKDSQNPVFTGDPGLFAGEASVIFDQNAGLYRMWFTRESGAYNDLNSLISALLTAAGPALVDDIRDENFGEIASLDSAAIKNVVSRLSIANPATSGYIDINAALLDINPNISCATSPDGVDWTVQPDSTFTGTSGEWDAYGVSAPSVIRKSDTEYSMWYTGWNLNSAAIRQFFADLNQLAAADIQTVLTDLLIEKDLGAAFSDLKTAGGSGYLNDILQDISDILTSSGGSIGLATSTDAGITWTKIPGAVVLRGIEDAWDNYGLYSPSVIKTTSGYQMWYTGFTVDFTPMMDLIDSADADFDDLEITLADMTYLQTGRAVSTDGITWVKDANPVMTADFGLTSAPLAPTTRGILSPSVLVDAAGNYHMWYTLITGTPGSFLDFMRKTLSFNGAVDAGLDSAIYYASSINGIAWVSQGAALIPGSALAWDKYAVGAPAVIQKGNNRMMWYTGYSMDDPKALINSLLDGNGINDSLAAGGFRSDIGLASAVTGTTPVFPPGIPPVNTTVAVDGLTPDVPLEIDGNGMVLHDVSLKNAAGTAFFNIPAGTRLLDVEGKPLAEFNLEAIAQPPASPSDYALILAFSFTPDGANFSPYLTLTLKYDPDKLPAGITEDNLYIAYWNGSQWQSIAGTVNKTVHTITAHVTHFTAFAILGKKATVQPQPTASAAPTPTITTSTPAATTVPTSVTPKPTQTTITTTPPATPTPTTTLPTEPYSIFNWWNILILFLVAFLVTVIILWRTHTRRTWN